MHRRVGEQMILFAQIAADEETKLTKLDSANRAQFSVHTLLDLCRVDDAEVRLPVNPHLYERNGVAAISLQMRQECGNVDLCCVRLHYGTTVRVRVLERTFLLLSSSKRLTSSVYTPGSLIS